MTSLGFLSRELALRIALAARVLPDPNLKQLLAVLSRCTTEQLTDSNVAAIDAATLKTAANGVFANVDDMVLQQVVAILSNTAPEYVLPSVQAYHAGDMPASVTIACATDDAIHVNGHFSTCTWFMVYQVSCDEARLIDIRKAVHKHDALGEDKNVLRAEQIQDCKVLYVISIGGPAAAKVVKLGIHPIKLNEANALTDILTRLQQVLAATPPPWLAKAMGNVASERLTSAWDCVE